jgi:cation diffusion facilitator family transporter
MPAPPPSDSLAGLALVNIAVAAGVMAIKFAAFWVTGSVALYSDALESVVNVATAAAAFAAIQVSTKPPDADHPFGHHKAEFFAAIFEGAMIVLAAVLIIIKAFEVIGAPQPLDRPELGIAINAVAAAINLAWALTLIRRGRAWRSPALEADGKHLMTDVLTSVGVVAGVVIVVATGISVLDPLIAIVVALHILWTGYHLIHQSMSQLLDRAASPEIEQRIRSVISANGHGALEVHDIRTRQAGRALFIEFHLVVPGDMTVDQAHAICDRIEAAIERDIDGSEVVIHVEPDHKAKPAVSGTVSL